MDRFQICTATQPRDDYFGFDRAFIKQLLRFVECTDEELLHALDWGFCNYLPNNPQVDSISTHLVNALQQAGLFFELIDDEIHRDWISTPRKYPHCFPFRVFLGSIEQNPDDSFRLVWNSSSMRANSYKGG